MTDGSVRSGSPTRGGLQALEENLAALDPATQPDTWAVAAYRLAVALSESPSENPRATAQRSLALLARASTLLDARRAPLEHARILNASGAIWRSLGEGVSAVDAFQRATQLMEGRARSVEFGAALSNLGLALLENGDLGTAVTTFERARKVLRPTTLHGASGQLSAGENHDEQSRAFAAASLNLAQALLARWTNLSAAARGDRTAESLSPAFAAVSEGLAVVDSLSAPMQYGMLQHTEGLLWMEQHVFEEAIRAFGRCLNVFTRSTFPFQHAVASFNRARASESIGELGHALLDYEAAAQVFDPRLHRTQWLESASRLAEVENRLRIDAPSAQRHDHIVAAIAIADPTDRANLLRERLTRLLGAAPMPQRSEFAMYFAALQRLSNRDVPLSDGLLRQTIEILMELPEDLLESALLGLLEAHATLTPNLREEADRRLDRAIQELLMGPQRMRMRDILYNAGWERP